MKHLKGSEKNVQELIKSLVHVLLSVCDIEVTLECEAMRIFPSYNILETRP